MGADTILPALRDAMLADTDLAEAFGAKIALGFPPVADMKAGRRIDIDLAASMDDDTDGSHVNAKYGVWCYCMFVEKDKQTAITTAAKYDRLIRNALSAFMANNSVGVLDTTDIGPTAFGRLETSKDLYGFGVPVRLMERVRRASR